MPSSLPRVMATEHLDERALDRLKWRCRRGMLENDLLIERFFERHADGLDESRAAALLRLMDLSDNDLLDLLLRRTEPGDELNSPEVREVLGLLRPTPH